MTPGHGFDLDMKGLIGFVHTEGHGQKVSWHLGKNKGSKFFPNSLWVFFFTYILVSWFLPDIGTLGLSLYREQELVRDCGLSSCSFPWLEELWAVVEFSPDASHKQPLAAAKEMGVSLQIDC